LSLPPVELTILLPAYKEADSLQQLLPQLRDQASKLTTSYEVLVVDARTKIDDTAEVCEEWGVRHVFRRDGNFYGDAMRTGIAEALGRFIVVMDADGSHNPRDLPSLWSERERFDVVIGSRYAPGGQTENPALLIAMSYVVNLTFRLAFHLDCKDVTNSFRLYRGDQLRTLKLECNNFDLVEEILIRLVAGPTKARVKEVPVIFERRKAGESKRNLVAFAVSYVQTLVRLRRFYQAARQEAQAKHAPSKIQARRPGISSVPMARKARQTKVRPTQGRNARGW
jgi:dolichol-phosphate mannosyltransferase